MNSGIYYIINIANRKKYIGSTRNLCSRKNEHWSKLRRGCHPNSHLQYSWNKYGEENFEYRPVEIYDDCNIMLEREAELIQKEKTFDRQFGYNLEIDPVKRTKSQDHKDKISRTLKANYKAGYKHPLLGTVWTEERKLFTHPMKGRKLTEQQIKSRPQYNQFKPVNQFTKDGKFLASFSSIKEASNVLGIQSSNITMCCKGNRLIAGGFIFKHKETQ